MSAVVLALGSSLVWGAADFGGGLLARRHAVLAVLLVSQASAITAAVLLVVAGGAGPPEAAAVVLGLGAGILGAGALAAFYRALAIGTMSIVAPITATGAAVPVVVGLLAGERPAALQVGGMAVAVVGIVLAAREPGGGVPAGDARAALRLAVTAAVGFGTFFVAVDEATSRATIPWVLLTVRTGELALVGVAALLLRPPLPRGAAALAPLALIGLLDVAANALYALSTTRGLLSVVSVVGSLYPVVTVLLARALLGERLSALQGAGVLATLGGVLAITAG